MFKIVKDLYYKLQPVGSGGTTNPTANTPTNTQLADARARLLVIEAKLKQIGTTWGQVASCGILGLAPCGGMPYTSFASTAPINILVDYPAGLLTIDVCLMVDLRNAINSPRKFGVDILDKIIAKKALTPNDCQLTEEESEEEMVTIYKAPATLAKATKELTQGYDPLDFPRIAPYLDGAAYFAPPEHRKVAEHWNRQYEAGIIEITMSKKDYEIFFKPTKVIESLNFGERLYRGPSPDMGVNPKEVTIPKEDFNKLNTYPRILKLN